jgi:hypothetical protein
MKIILFGIIAALAILLWQNTEALKAASLPSLDVAQIHWVTDSGSVRNQVSAGTVNFGDEIISAAPGTWTLCRSELNSAYMIGVCSDVWGSAYGSVSVLALEGHRYGDTGWQTSPLIYGFQPKGNPGDAGALRVALYYDRICFAPDYSGQHFNWLDSCMIRILTDGQPDLKFTAGDKYFYLSEVSELLGR